VGKLAPLVAGVGAGIAVMVAVFLPLHRTASGHDLYGTEALGHFLLAAAAGLLSGGLVAYLVWARRRP
jgi:hypothetical protein